MSFFELSKISTINRTSKRQEAGIKGFLYWWFENSNNPKRFYFEIVLNLIILFSVILVFIEFFGDSKPQWLSHTNNIITLFFIFEYFIRFYIASDFRSDLLDSVNKAIGNKLKHIFTFSSIVDLLAILPALFSYNFFRSFRLLRFARFLRVLRVLKLFKNMDRWGLFFRKMREGQSKFIILIAVSSIILVLNASLLMVFERNAKTTSVTLNTFSKSFLYLTKLIEFSDDEPQTRAGKFIATFILFANLAFFGLFISMVTTTMESIMDSFKDGKLGKLKMKDHILIFGLTGVTQELIDELLKARFNTIVVVTLQNNPDINGVIYCKGDFTETQVLESLNLPEAKMVVILAESQHEDDSKMIDMRTVMAVSQVRGVAENVHIIAELGDKNNEDLLFRLGCNEIIFKETIDANLIASCISMPHISSMIYELLNQDGKKMSYMNLDEIGIEEGETYINVKKYGLEHDINFLGIIRNGGSCELMPTNEFKLQKDDQLIHIV